MANARPRRSIPFTITCAGRNAPVGGHGLLLFLLLRHRLSSCPCLPPRRTISPPPVFSSPAAALSWLPGPATRYPLSRRRRLLRERRRGQGQGQGTDRTEKKLPFPFPLPVLEARGSAAAGAARTGELRREIELLLTPEEMAVLDQNEIPDATRISSPKWHPLHTYALALQIPLMDKLLDSRIDINLVHKDGFTPLHKAGIGKKEAVISHLLRKGAKSSCQGQGWSHAITLRSSSWCPANCKATD